MKTFLGLLLTFGISIAFGCGDDDDGAGVTTPSQDAEAGANDGSLVSCPEITLDEGEQALSLIHDGIERSFLVHYPTGVPENTALPVVFNFHALMMTAAGQAAESGFPAKADEEGFILVHPEGIANATDGFQSWNSGICCADDDQRDDVGFALAILEELKQKACVDPRRVYATGMSNGGHMAHRLGCEAADVFAAVASVAGILLIPFEQCQPSRTIPLLDFHGIDDPVVPYEGGISLRGLDYPSVASVMSNWAELNDCSTEPVQTLAEGAATCETYQECRSGVRVTLCSLEGMGHCWPGAGACVFGTAVNDISATDLTWDFFSEFALP